MVVTQENELESVVSIMASGEPAVDRSLFVVPYEFVLGSPVDCVCLISCQPYSKIAADYPGVPRIQTLHGIADKRGELFGPCRLADFTHLFSPAPAVTELAQQRLLDEIDHESRPIEIVDTGCPKTDDLFDGTYRRNQVLRDLGLPSDRPSVLYAPTWEKEASLEQGGERIVAELAATGLSVMVKPHPLSVADPEEPFLIKEGHGGKDWKKILRSWETRFSNVRWVRETYANPFLVAADLLISEGSGVAFEYVLLDKPIVFIDTPLVTERYGSENLHHRLRSCGATATGPDKLADLVLRHLDEPTLLATQRHQLAEQTSFNRGTATRCALAKINQLLGAD